MQFRHEVKHEINCHDMLILRQRLRAVMKPDSHAVDERYEIRSLYFDNLDTAVLWTIRYLTKGVSVKKVADREKVRAKIQEGYENNKMPYSFNWFIKEEE